MKIVVSRFLIFFIFFKCLFSEGSDFESVDYLNDYPRVVSWREIRDDGIVKQRFDFSCGASALANVLGRFGFYVSEEEVIGHIGLKDQYSFSDLAKAASEYAVSASGFATDYDGLMLIEYPAILYLERFQNGHFVVLSNIDNDYISIVDPAWGRLILSRKLFESYWYTRNDVKHPGKVVVFWGKSLDILNAQKLKPIGISHFESPLPIINFYENAIH